MKLLIADDDPVSRCLMERILKKDGYEVVTAADGAQALEELSRENGPRLALLDWMMPKLDGLEVCRQIRGRQGQSYVYITMLTSKLSNSDVVAGLEAGSDDYLTKPCNPEELKARLRTGQRILQLENTLVEAREAMRFTATHDALTGLWNRGAIMNLLKNELTRSNHNSPAALILCDVDHFKRVNDMHGHLVGDEVLREVASRLQKAVRRCDAVGRYGGEEFLIVLKDCAVTNLAARAEHVREAVSGERFLGGTNSLFICISIGALAVDCEDDTLPVEVLLKKVDNALYLAKSKGRNRVVCAGGSGIASGQHDFPLIETLGEDRSKTGLVFRQ